MPNESLVDPLCMYIVSADAHSIIPVYSSSRGNPTDPPSRSLLSYGKKLYLGYIYSGVYIWGVANKGMGTKGAKTKLTNHGSTRVSTTKV